jgi:hypothetical protein
VKLKKFGPPGCLPESDRCGLDRNITQVVTRQPVACRLVRRCLIEMSITAIAMSDDISRAKDLGGLILSPFVASLAYWALLTRDIQASSFIRIASRLPAALMRGACLWRVASQAVGDPPRAAMRCLTRGSLNMPSLWGRHALCAFLASRTKCWGPRDPGTDVACANTCRRQFRRASRPSSDGFIPLLDHRFRPYLRQEG